MTQVVRLIGYWDGPEAGEGLPDVCGFVKDDSVPGEWQAVVDYLRSGTEIAWAAGTSRCRICGAWNGSAELTDGVHFMWPEGLAHYVEVHGVRLPDEVVAVASRGPAGAVDEERFEEAEVDGGWWRGQGGEIVEHRPGCRHSSTPGHWCLPGKVEVYLDGVPEGRVGVLAKLKRLIGADWAISDLREMLTRQPITVGLRSPAELHRALKDAPELRPYFFHGEPGRLVGLWLDTR